MPTILDGKAVAKELQAELKARVDALYLEYVFPVLATVRVGEDAAAVSYETGMLKAAKATGVRVRRYILPADVSQTDVAQLIREINADRLLSGLLLLRPLPEHMDEDALTALIQPEKDVDCANLHDLPLFVPCTAEACMELLRRYALPVEGRRAVVLGRSRTAGLPAAKLLLEANATVTVCHSRTENLPAVAREGDILLAALGRRGMITADYIKPGAVVLDVGIHRDPETGRLCGDVDFDAVSPLASALTPVPGGVGAVTSTILMRHVIDGAERNAK
ncbi:MAG: bifunctional 5,10-methylenetetrahydrofolate dehydrogenase/5,10-methenyltetrahydrofolate cyclohydrolase [Oscillospiraceae bacterium]|jgi:5,10-methylene-tetrahydrofolate dehydrogenase/Methenyl tetrahydrofolate cyclohydrolase|nr:bifunctional 5,10-methylenetetrahydrofolate dehydrogenase/5,10-methenyltetrahydrofolate cyclohydrolase [Oscillospiraceae bacterium]